MVVPPRGLRLPVLPFKLPNGRLSFPLCRTCALIHHKKGLKMSNYKCQHTDRERQWITTVTHLELNAALERGYRVRHLFRTMEWFKWSNEVLKGFVRQFVKLKTQASGWPQDVKNDDEKEAFLEKYREMGIELEEDKICYNAGLRFLAKICNNS